MRIGSFILPAAGGGVHGLVRDMVAAEQRGMQSAWIAHIRGADALMVLALAGQQTQTIELGTFVVPTFPRHPSSLAQQALTTQAFSGNRLALGIGLSHRVSMEQGLGFDWDHPLRHMKEYLAVLQPLLRGEAATYAGTEYTVNDYQIDVPGTQPPPVLVAALGPQMIRLAGRASDGTALWLGGPTYIGQHHAPALREAAAKAGRPEPRIVASVPVCVTNDAAGVRRRIQQVFARYGDLPSYRAILDREGAADPSDVALVGTADEVAAGLLKFADAGVTDFAAAVFANGAEADETWELLAGWTA